MVACRASQAALCHAGSLTVVKRREGGREGLRVGLEKGEKVGSEVRVGEGQTDGAGAEGAHAGEPR